MKKAQPNLIVKRLCELFDTSLSTYYHQTKPAQRSADEHKALAILKILHTQTFQTYGRRRMKVALKNKGIHMGHFKVARLMREHDIIAKFPKKPHYYQGGNVHPTTPNLLKRKFNPPSINTHWVGDITYIRSHQGWSYLATVMDLATKEIVGTALAKTPDAQLAKKALTNAIKAHKPDTKELLFHSDQGVQYSAKTFTNLLKLHGITASMSRRGNCWDNAVQERFFRNLKTERLNALRFINHEAVVGVVEQYIRFYNYIRLNSAIGYLTPAQKRENLKKAA